MNKKILKSIAVVLSAAVTSLVIPVFGQWYTQKTGFDPIAFYAVAGFGGMGISIATLVNIWDN
jgi:hypothetical protein